VKAIELLETGAPEVLQLRETPTPKPGDGEVLIHVAASGVNFIGRALYVCHGRARSGPAEPSASIRMTVKAKPV
jgi:NADPH:quinone reductase-like Zn-dependent oxidoreductase